MSCEPHNNRYQVTLTKEVSRKFFVGPQTTHFTVAIRDAEQDKNHYERRRLAALSGSFGASLPSEPSPVARFKTTDPEELAQILDETAEMIRLEIG